MQLSRDRRRFLKHLGGLCGAFPVAFRTSPGMVSNRFAKSLEHAGGNVTGMEQLPPGVTAKRLTLLKTVAPSISRVALLSTTPGNGGHETQAADAEQAAASLRISVKVYRATSLPELETALASIASDDIERTREFPGRPVNREPSDDRRFRRAASHPSGVSGDDTYGTRRSSWAPDLVEQQRIVTSYVDKILKGAKPGDLPIRYPPGYAWTSNLVAAKGLELALSPSVLAQADRVIS